MMADGRSRVRKEREEKAKLGDGREYYVEGVGQAPSFLNDKQREAHIPGLQVPGPRSNGLSMRESY